MHDQVTQRGAMLSLPVFDHAYGSRTGRAVGVYLRVGKPVVDVTAGLVLGMLLLPIVLAVALAVRLGLGSPVLFRQARVGRDGNVFTVYKFRTMRPDRRAGAGEHHGPDRRVSHKTGEDPRLTPLGRFLRRYSLDELPQLWNVMLGDMSLVGPRPELVQVVRTYQPWQHRRHMVRPGLTGLWQVTARADGPMHEHTDIDLAYIDSVSPWTDLRILARTLPAALGRQKGV